MLLFKAAAQAQKAIDYILGKVKDLPAFFSYWMSWNKADTSPSVK